MLKNCPECELMVSDKAITCPHCGYPLVPTSSQKPRKSNKRMRLPNGFGQITEIKGKNLRNPYRVMVPAGKTETGRPISKLLKPNAYFATYNEAYQALVDYNRNPYDLENIITVKQLYERWSKEYFESLSSESSRRTIISAWSKCSSVENMNVKDIRARHIKGCMDSVESTNMKSRIKSMFNIMLDYALEYELVDKNYARTFSTEIDETPVKSHMCFTDEEMKILWKHKDEFTVGLILIQCYSGWRPQEIGLIKEMNDEFYVGGMKTKAGTDRRVPIHPAVLELAKNKQEQSKMRGSEYVFACEDGSKLTYDKYKHRFDNVVKALGINPEHRPHDARKQFITMCKKYNVDEYAIKTMVGHNISDITEKTYTERDPQWLRTEISKIPSVYE